MRFVKTIARLGSVVAFYTPWISASTPFYNEPPAFNVQFYGGFREDYLKFHIGGDHHHHHGHDCKCEWNEKEKKNVTQKKSFSEVKWWNLKIAQVGASMNYSSSCHNYYTRATANYGRIMQGEGTVSNQFKIIRECFEDHDPKPIHPSKPKKEHCPHCGDDHYPTCDNGEGWRNEQDRLKRLHHHHAHTEHSKQRADAGYGYVCDFNGGVGWKVVSAGGRSWIAGIIGYSFDRQNLKMRHFRQKKDSLCLIQPNAFERLHSSYLTSWIGPWIGIDFSAQVECDVTVFGSGEWHNVNYRGKGHWSISDDFSARIKHHTRGYGAVANLGFDWKPCDRWGFGVLANYQQWSTRKGHNRAKFCNFKPLSDEAVATMPVAKSSTLFRVKWYSYSFSAVITYQF